MEQQPTELNSFDNLFDELLSKNQLEISRNFLAYSKNNPLNIVFLSEIYNLDKMVWTGYIDITTSEYNLRTISEKLNTILNIVDIEDKKIVTSFSKGKTILSMDYKNSIKRNTETRKLIKIYNKN